jgi:hypothetical protein
MPTRILTRIRTIHGNHLEIASAVGFITSTIEASAVASPIDPMRSSIIMAAPVRITGTITGTTERITKRCSHTLGRNGRAASRR